MIPRSPRTASLIGALLFTSSVLLLQLHIGSVRRVRQDVLPLAGTLLTLQHRSAVLAEQIELSQEESDARNASAVEKLHAYILPSKDTLPRLLGLFELLEWQLRGEKKLQSLGRIDFTEEDSPARVPDGATVSRATVSLIVTREGADDVLSLLDLTGLLTVGDALSQQELQSLFNLTEVHNPAGIVAIETFLGGDLLAYAENPRRAEQPVLQAFSSDQFLRQFHSLLARTRVQQARTLLGGELGTGLRESTLWPTQFLELEHATLERLEGEWYRLTVTLLVYGRES